MEDIRIVNRCKNCNSRDDWIKAPIGDEDLFICRVCGHQQCLIEEMDYKIYLTNKGEK